MFLFLSNCTTHLLLTSQSGTYLHSFQTAHVLSLLPVVAFFPLNIQGIQLPVQNTVHTIFINPLLLLNNPLISLQMRAVYLKLRPVHINHSLNSANNCKMSVHVKKHPGDCLHPAQTNFVKIFAWFPGDIFLVNRPSTGWTVGTVMSENKNKIFWHSSLFLGCLNM